MNAKDFLTKALAKHEAGKNQVVELPVSIIKSALTNKKPGACDNQETHLKAVDKLRDSLTVFQSADDWLTILGEL